MQELSKKIEELIKLWNDWMTLNNITTNHKISYDIRRKTSERQEFLISKRYQIIEEINEIFDDLI